LTLASGCGAEGDYEDEAPNTLARERLPVPTKITKIDSKHYSLPEGLVADYYAQPFGAETVDSRGAPYRYYQGSRGLGAIYIPEDRPAVAIYGAFLQEWANWGYEGAPLMGYPLGDAVNGQQEFQTELTAPTVANNGLSEIHHFLAQADGGRVEHVYVNYYLNSYGGTLSTQPQQCRAIDSFYQDPGTVLAEVYGDGVVHRLSCGTPPPGFDPNAEEHPGPDLDDI
jgi:hypothetical protein